MQWQRRWGGGGVAGLEGQTLDFKLKEAKAKSNTCYWNQTLSVVPQFPTFEVRKMSRPAINHCPPPRLGVGPNAAQSRDLLVSTSSLIAGADRGAANLCRRWPAQRTCKVAAESKRLRL